MKEMTDPEKKYRDLSELAGAWDKETAEEFEQTQEIFNEIDDEL